MSNLLAQIILAQRSPDDDGWMNILVVVVMAVIWMVGAVVKAMKTKSGDQQQPSRTPSGKQPAPGRAVQQQIPGRAQRPAGSAPRHPEQHSGVEQKRTTLADLRAAARKFAAEAEQAFQTQTTKPTPKLPRPATKPRIQPEATPIIEPVVAPIKALADEPAAAAQMLPSQHLSELLSDYTDPEKLRKAILHYEILGPPLSLRD